MARGRRAIAGAIVVSVALAVPGVLLLAALERAYPPDLARSRDLSRVLVDRAGTPLRYALTADDRLRLATPVAEVDPKLLALLIAYEDKRYFTHSGVDPLAVLRALGQWLRHGHPVSGASTLTMQTVRLLEPRPRTLATKLVEMLRAWQLARRLDKHEILALYLTLAPYGGNVEGLAAATRYYLNVVVQDIVGNSAVYRTVEVLQIALVTGIFTGLLYLFFQLVSVEALTGLARGAVGGSFRTSSSSCSVPVCGSGSCRPGNGKVGAGPPTWIGVAAPRFVPGAIAATWLAKTM